MLYFKQYYYSLPMANTIPKIVRKVCTDLSPLSYVKNVDSAKIYIKTSMEEPIKIPRTINDGQRNCDRCY